MRVAPENDSDDGSSPYLLTLQQQVQLLFCDFYQVSLRFSLNSLSLLQQALNIEVMAVIASFDQPDVAFSTQKQAMIAYQLDTLQLLIVLKGKLLHILNFVSFGP